jgi:predicted NAD-dependent protein-ADP-ribosyltransferase YbiA (DUF1768 family)
MGGPSNIDGEVHEECDNFAECKFEIGGLTYCSVENYFQSQKATNKEDFEIIRNSGPGESCWEAGTKIKIREDWNKVKLDVMLEGSKAKISQNETFLKKLITTKGPVIHTGSSDFWNYWNGRIFERVRAELRQNGEEDLKVAAELAAEMDNYKITV